MKFYFYIPSKHLTGEEINSEGDIEFVSKINSNTINPFYKILARKWLFAASGVDHSLSNVIENNQHLKDLSSGDVVFSIDHFVGYTNEDEMLFSDLSRADKVIFNCQAVKKSNASGGMSLLRLDRTSYFNLDSPWDYNYIDGANASAIIEPMGCPNSWVEPYLGKKKDRVVFLDEPHFSLDITDINSINFNCFVHALEVCKILHLKGGYQIRTFSRSQNSSYLEYIKKHYNFVNVFHEGSWLQLNELISEYAKATIFYSWFTETHGYPIYEAMQTGAIIAGYSESLNTMWLKNHQDSIILSVYQAPDLSAMSLLSLCELRDSDKWLRHNIESARNKFSSESFGERIIKRYNSIR